MGKDFSPCCSNGGPCCPPPHASRYPIQAQIPIDTALWAQPQLPASPQHQNQNQNQNKKSKPFTYSGQNLAALDFPVGGFGAGNVKLAGDGSLQKWTVVNQAKSTLVNMPNCFFAISTTPMSTENDVVDVEQSQSFILSSPETYTERNCNLPPHEPAHVSRAAVERLQSLPGVNSLTVTGTYPIAEIQYDITGFPLELSMETTSPCIPQDLKNSSLPCAIFTFTVSNPTSSPMNVRLLQSQQNFIGWDGLSSIDNQGINPGWGGNVNTPIDDSTRTSMAMTRLSSLVPLSMSLSGIKSAATNITVLPCAKDSNDIWNQFIAKEDTLPAASKPSTPSASTKTTCCGVVQSLTLAPHATEQVSFVVTWYFPNRTRDGLGLSSWAHLPNDLGNRYCDTFENSEDVADYVVANFQYLCATTRLYTNTMFSTTISPELLDSAAGRVACLRGATMWWTNAACSLKVGNNGCIMGTEGNGCCPLNCTHVYGYTTLMERLFPTLAKDMRSSDFIRNFNLAVGGCTMRFGGVDTWSGWAIDGACACIIKTYLVVQQSDPELQFLQTVWPNVKAQMKYIQDKFDITGDGILTGPQQNTYDTPMASANTFIGSYYVTVLKAMASMSTLMNETKEAAAYNARAKLSATSYDRVCFNADFGYYIANVTLANCKDSYGPGCFVDQLCAVGLSTACGFGHVFKPCNEEQAHSSLLKYNVVVKPPFQDMQKHFYPGDVGITVCTYPNGKLGNGMMYDTLVSTGFTSPNIAGMLLERNVDGAQYVIYIYIYIKVSNHVDVFDVVLTVLLTSL